MVLTLVAVRLSYEWARGIKIAPVLIILGLPFIWIVLSIHAAQLNDAG
jgi:hypothetical protein